MGFSHRISNRRQLRPETTTVATAPAAAAAPPATAMTATTAAAATTTIPAADTATAAFCTYVLTRLAARGSQKIFHSAVPSKPFTSSANTLPGTSIAPPAVVRVQTQAAIASDAAAAAAVDNHDDTMVMVMAMTARVRVSGVVIGEKGGGREGRSERTRAPQDGKRHATKRDRQWQVLTQLIDRLCS